jgi:hypothetical protein
VFTTLDFPVIFDGKFTSSQIKVNNKNFENGTKISNSWERQQQIKIAYTKNMRLKGRMLAYSHFRIFSPDVLPRKINYNLTCYFMCETCSLYLKTRTQIEIGNKMLRRIFDPKGQQV